MAVMRVVGVATVVVRAVVTSSVTASAMMAVPVAAARKGLGTPEKCCCRDRCNE